MTGFFVFSFFYSLSGKSENKAIFRCVKCGLEVALNDFDLDSGKCCFCSYRETAEYFIRQRQRAFAEWLQAKTNYIKLKRRYLKNGD